ncbi:MAG: hypothetical protein ABW047_06655 [Nitrospiraceae bacterium]
MVSQKRVTVSAIGVVMVIGATWWVAGLSTPWVTQAAEPEMKIEVTMKNGGYEVKGHSSPGSLTAIVLRNQDTMAHGFSSNLFKQVAVRKEGDVIEITGHGVKSYHVLPGKTGTLYFTRGHSEGRETQQYPFWCDMHPHMKGEFLVVETAGEIGGG